MPVSSQVHAVLDKHWVYARVGPPPFGEQWGRHAANRGSLVFQVFNTRENLLCMFETKPVKLGERLERDPKALRVYPTSNSC
eukprot:46976-Prorocentrum_lima.AAC.1